MTDPFTGLVDRLVNAIEERLAGKAAPIVEKVTDPIVNTVVQGAENAAEPIVKTVEERVTDLEGQVKNAHDRLAQMELLTFGAPQQ